MKNLMVVFVYLFIAGFYLFIRGADFLVDGNLNKQTEILTNQKPYLAPFGKGVVVCVDNSNHTVKICYPDGANAVAVQAAIDNYTKHGYGVESGSVRQW